jgi:hypothetical protein
VLVVVMLMTKQTSHRQKNRYQTSLEQFLGVFSRSLNESKASPVPTKRIHNIIEHFTYEAYCYTIRGLYTADKFLLTIMLAMKIDLRAGTLKQVEFDVFIKGGSALDLNAVEEKVSSGGEEVINTLNILLPQSHQVNNTMYAHKLHDFVAFESWFLFFGLLVILLNVCC